MDYYVLVTGSKMNPPTPDEKRTDEQRTKVLRRYKRVLIHIKNMHAISMDIWDIWDNKHLVAKFTDRTLALAYVKDVKRLYRPWELLAEIIWQ